MARRKARPASPAAPPYLTRTIPPYEVLSEEGLEQVERHADQLLDEIGLEIRGDLEAIRLWRTAGARISGPCSSRARASRCAAGWLVAGLTMSCEKFVMDQDQLGSRARCRRA